MTSRDRAAYEAASAEISCSRWRLSAIAILFAIFAIAGPSIGFVTMPFADREANRVVAIDVSNSMLAEDVGTSRLAAAKAIATRMIDAYDGRTIAVTNFPTAAGTSISRSVRRAKANAPIPASPARHESPPRRWPSCHSSARVKRTWKVSTRKLSTTACIS